MDPKEYQSLEAGKVILTPMGFWGFLPNPLPPDITWSSSLVSILYEAERNLSRLSTLTVRFLFLDY